MLPLVGGFAISSDGYFYISRKASKKKVLIHGGESRDILNVYSDKTCKKIDHYFFNTQWIFMR